MDYLYDSAVLHATRSRDVEYMNVSTGGGPVNRLIALEDKEVANFYFRHANDRPSSLLCATTTTILLSSLPTSTSDNNCSRTIGTTDNSC